MTNQETHEASNSLRFEIRCQNCGAWVDVTQVDHISHTICPGCRPINTWIRAANIEAFSKFYGHFRTSDYRIVRPNEQQAEEDSPHLSDEAFEEIKRSLSPAKFTELYLNHWSPPEDD